MSKKDEPVMRQSRTFKGEMVEDVLGRRLTGWEQTKKQNPYKTPPSNLTNKDQEIDEKG